MQLGEVSELVVVVVQYDGKSCDRLGYSLLDLNC